MRFGILGPLEITVDDRPRALRGPKLGALLAALLVHPNETVSADHLVEVLWGPAGRGGGLPDKPANALQSQVTRLRTVVESGPAGGAATDRRLAGIGTGYRLRVASDELDATLFEETSALAAKEVDAQDWAAAVRLTEKALALWRGAALEDFAEAGFARARAEQLEEQRLVTMDRRIQALLGLGRHRDVVADARDLVDRNPLREQSWMHLIVALYRSDRQGEALRAHNEVRMLLAEEMGILPCAELVRLEQQVLEQDPDLDWVDTSAPGTVTAAPAAASGPPVTHLVTFLFTDIEHSASRWGADPTGMTEALRLHDGCLRQAIADHGGHVFGRPAEGFCAVFDRPVDAVAAALAAQRHLRRDQRRDQEPLRVRMAVATGEAELREGHWFGLTVNRVARMRDAGHGGQILLGAATGELVRDQMPPGTEMADVGRWVFDGFSQPERVYQLRHTDLPAGFPPLRSGRPHTGQVPRQSTSFLGREHDVERVAAALRPGRLVTLTGEGGIGKTRLALELAHRALPADHPDGVWFCDVSTLDGPDGLAEHLAAALQLSVPLSGGDRRSQVVAALQQARLLLVIDSCERLRGPVAGLLDEVVGAGTEATFLATSRAPLRAHGERVVKLGPLAVRAGEGEDPTDAPAVQLLVDRAEAAGAPASEDEDALASIARALDGLPLAIELAAPRLATLGPGDLARRLTGSGRLVDGSAPGTGDRRTLRATIDGSFHLLGEPARDLFGALSVFQGGWTLDTAESVSAAVGLARDAVAGILADLVDQSMVRVDLATGSAARYRMLDAIRAYAADYLAETGRHEAVATHHAAHFVELAETAARHRRGPLEPAWVEELDVEFDNLRAAYRWLVGTGRAAQGLRLVTALADDLLMRERLEVGRWAEELAELPATEGEPLRAVALALASNTALVEGRFDDAVRLGRASLAAGAAAGPDADRPHSWIAHNTMALLTLTGTTGDHWHDHVEAMERATAASGDPMPAAVAEYIRVLIADMAGLPAAALPYAEALLDRAAATGNPSLLAMGLLSHGRAISASDPDRAVRRCRDALSTASTARNTLVVQQSLRTLGELHSRGGDQAAALDSLRKVAHGFEASGNVAEQMQTVGTMLEPLVEMGALEAAATLCSALAGTPLRYTATWRLVDHTVAKGLAPDRYVTARRAGAAMDPREFVAYASRVAQDLAGGSDSGSGSKGGGGGGGGR